MDPLIEDIMWGLALISCLDSCEETLNQIYLELEDLLGGEAPGVALSAVLYPGLDVFADVELSLLEVVAEGKPRRAIPDKSEKWAEREQ